MVPLLTYLTIRGRWKMHFAGPAIIIYTKPGWVIPIKPLFSALLCFLRYLTANGAAEENTGGILAAVIRCKLYVYKWA